MQANLGGPGVRRAQQLAGLGSWELHLPSGRLSVGPGIRSLLQLPPEAPDPSFDEYVRSVHADDRARLVARWQALLESGSEYVDEHRLLLPDGSVRHVRAVGCAELDATGAPVHLRGITLDITDLKLASQEAERQRDLSRAILNSLPEGYLLSRQGVILEVNGAFCDLTGYSEHEVVGTGAPYPFWAPDGNADLDEFRARLHAGGAGRADVVLLHRSGQRLDVHVVSTPLVDSERTSGIWLTVFRDTSEQRRYEQLLLSRAQTDPLTGLHNSRTFRDRLREEAHAASEDRPLCLALIDLDHFKRINDSHGHATGDEVLRAAVDRFLQATDSQFHWARVGGEEFALLMPATSMQAATSLIGSVLTELRKTPVPPVGTVTASAGIAQLVRPAADDSLFRAADVLLYQAKASGRDRLLAAPVSEGSCSPAR